MRFLRFQNGVLALSLLAVAGFVAVGTSSAAYGQSNVTGALSGSVTDATGAVVPGATVVLVDTGTDSTQTVKTNDEGHYTFANLKPGTYKVSASAESLKSDTTQVTVLLGTTVPGDIKVTPTGNKEVVEVSSTAAPLVDTENIALATTFAEQQIQDLPTPGGDVTTVAFTAPGVVVNAGGGGIGGNFSSNGLPGISNLFVLNGFDNQDPFLNLNNSGSSNLTLGQGELQEATVIQNAYNSQYGRAAGAEIQYTTKSGGNSFHGEADYNYNGSLLNANGWFNENEEIAGGQPNVAPHAVSNEWAGNAGGPIIKNKLFFFADYEGLRYVLPSSSGFVTFPSPQLATYIEQNVPTSVAGLYAKAMNDYTKSAAYKTAVPVTNGSGGNQDSATQATDNGVGIPNAPVFNEPNPLTGQPGALGCGLNYPYPGTSVDGNGNPIAPLYYGGLNGTPAPGGGVFGVSVPCMLVGSASVNNVNKEWLFTGRADWYISDKHKIYGRYKMDRGSQPTATSVIDPLFSALSIQPEYEGQFNDSYVISPTMTNVLVAASNWYSAYFGPPSVAASLAEFPMNMLVPDDGLDGSGVAGAPGLGASNPTAQGLGVFFALTQGRNVTQYQIEDDFSWIKGKNTMKFGENFRRDLVEDYDSQIGTVFPDSVQLSLGDFASGNINGAPGTNFWDAIGANSYSQSYAAAPTAHLALYNLGAFFQDEIQVSSRLKLTVGGRIDRTGSPVCHGGCFATYTPGTFPASGVGLSTAYNSASGGSITAVNNNPFPVEKFNFQPRGGFNFSIDDKTEIRGGVGIFSDLYPAAFLDSVIQNFPNENAVNVYSGSNAPAQYGAGTAGAFAGQVNSTVQTAFLKGQGVAPIDNALNAEGVPFAPPNLGAYFPGTFKVPEYLEYNLQIQRQLSRSDAIIVNYVGNYGYRGVLQNADLNASVGSFTENSTGGEWDSAGSFANLPVTPPDPRFSKVTALTNNGHSNYNAGWVSYKHTGHGVTGQVSYTYSHSLDLISNGGEGQGFIGSSLGSQLTPNLATQNLNYASSDYDIRNNLTGDLVYEEPYKFSNKLVEGLAGGWILGAKTYLRGGEPFSIVNGAALAGFHTIGGPLLADLAPGVSQHQLINHSPSNPHLCVFTDCLDSDLDIALGNKATQFVPYSAQSDFGNFQRNQERGPHYVDTDLSLLKRIVKVEGFTFELGANAYNVWNHANFSQPVNDISSPAFGQITSAVAPPTSPYGSFQGAAVTQRLLQIHGRITF